MQNALIVGLGGFIGSIFRYYLGGLIFQLSGSPRFPIGTLGVNTLGCLVIGILAGLAEHLHYFSPQLRLLLFTGLLGGFTTFSAFGFETFFLAQSKEFFLAALNICTHLIFCLGAVWLGHFLISRQY